MADKGTVQKKEKTYTVAGYTFNSKEEAQEAKDELNAIKYVSVTGLLISEISENWEKAGKD